MRIISADGIGLAAMVRAAEKLQEVADEFNVDLGMVDDPVVGQALVVAPKGARRLGVTVEHNPRIVELGDG